MKHDIQYRILCIWTSSPWNMFRCFHDRDRQGFEVINQQRNKIAGVNQLWRLYGVMERLETFDSYLNNTLHIRIIYIWNYQI